MAFVVFAAAGFGASAAAAEPAPPSTRVERDQALDFRLNGFRSPIPRPDAGRSPSSWPLYKESPAAAQQDFRPPPPPPPETKKTPAPPPPPPCAPNSPNWPNCLQPAP